MARTVAIGVQDFETLIKKDCFYIDKTGFIKEWWESEDAVTLITRPRRFGKTLNMSMLERFFSNRYEGQGELFEGLDIWQEKKYRELQGTYPVISLSFSRVKKNNYLGAKKQICQIITELFDKNVFLLESGLLTDNEQCYYRSVNDDMDEEVASVAIHRLSDYLQRYYGKKVIILLDEYDTPMQEAYVNGYWEELVPFTRNLFNAAFKTNPYLDRAVITGITRISKESMFSDLNNLNVVTITSNEYASYFGFTETEVFAAMDEFGLINQDEVKYWYDGFTFGDITDIYNPWSIVNFLRKQKLDTYWANTSSNSLAGNLIRTGDPEIKMHFEDLLQGHSIHSEIDEEMVFDQLDNHDENAIWSLLFASGYLKPLEIKEDDYELELTNYEVRKTFESLVSGWFRKDRIHYNQFVKALLQADIDGMNEYMNRFALKTISYFDSAGTESGRIEPERFYHGFVLGLLVDLKGRYEVTSNRESGFGRYDVMLRPLNDTDDGIILEFKVYNPRKEQSMEETVQAALQQIEEKQYEQTLIDQGIRKERIRKYGFAFQGKEVLIG